MTSYSRDGSALDCALQCLERHAPEQTRRACAALDVLLQGVRTSTWPEVAWQFSELTPDGFPLELTFSSSPENAVRYALEVAGPEVPENQRLRTAFRLYRDLTGRSVSAAVERIMSTIQMAHELSYGAWFGGAHTESTDRYKIYAEVPQGACVEAFLPGVFTEGLPIAHCNTRPVMLGYQPDTNIREVYFRVSHLAAEDIGKLLWKHDLGHRYQETSELIGSIARRPGATAALAGFSLAFNGAPKAKAISLFTEARFLLGSDANTRRHLLNTAQGNNWPFGAYEQITRAHQNREDKAGGQGVIAWIISDDNPVELRVSVRPPEKLALTPDCD